MYKITAICDKCKKEVTHDGECFSKNKYGWQEITIEIAQYERKRYMLCLECRGELGLVKDQATHKEPKIQSVEEKLFEVISEIVAGELENIQR